MARCKLFLSFFFVLSAGVYSQENTTNSFNFKWDNGFKLESKDSLFLLKFGGDIFIDHGFFYQDSKFLENFGLLNSRSGTEIRRARLYFSGKFYENINFKFQLDFAGDRTKLKDVYIGISDIPAIGNFRVGHFHEPFRLSTLTSAKYSTFMERGANTYFSQLRNSGGMVFNDFLNKRLSAQFGAFRNANNSPSEAFSNDGYVLTGRVTGIPYRDISTRQLLHIGLAHSYRKPDNNEYDISITPGSHLLDKYLDSERLQDVNEINLTNFELAYVHGPFSAQSEFLTALVNADDYNNRFWNYYLELGYFITGESKNYVGSYEGFGRVSPNRNFQKSQKGFGALEVALRYSKVNLNDTNIDYGIQSEIAAGVNWYLNPVTRVMLDYVRTDIEDRGLLQIVMARFQIVF